jgi:2-methylcitrate dehydratase PrpD
MIESVEKNLFLETVKWAGTACVVVAATCRAFDYHTVDLLVSIAGAGLWGYAGFAMKDKALIAVNAFVVGILLVGVVV